MGALQVWRSALVGAGRAFLPARTGFLALLIYPAVLLAAGMLVGGTGFLGGLVLGLLHAACAGSYLFLIEDPVRSGRRVRLAELRESIGAYFHDVISVLFLFWLASLAVDLLGGGVLGLVLHLVAFVVFNAVPEVIYLGRSSSTEALGRSLSFIQQAWPEWFIPQLAILGLLNLLLPGEALTSLSWFGPFFGFLDAAQGLLHSASRLPGEPLALARGFALVATAHFVMLLRGRLYLELAGTSRRARAWKARLGGPP